MLELNVSCPNVETGLIMGADPGETARAVERLRPLTDKPLIVKLTPNATDPAAVAAAAEDAGADAVSLINTLKGMALDPRPGGRGSAAAAAASPARGPGDRARAGPRRLEAGRDPRDRHGRHRLGRHAADFLAAGALRRGRHRELPRPGRGPPDRRRAAGFPCASPKSGKRAGRFPVTCGNFWVGFTTDAQKKPAKQDKTLKQPEPG